MHLRNGNISAVEDSLALLVWIEAQKGGERAVCGMLTTAPEPDTVRAEARAWAVRGCRVKGEAENRDVKCGRRVLEATRVRQMGETDRAREALIQGVRIAVGWQVRMS